MFVLMWRREQCTGLILNLKWKRMGWTNAHSASVARASGTEAAETCMKKSGMPWHQDRPIDARRRQGMPGFSERCSGTRRAADCKGTFRLPRWHVLVKVRESLQKRFPEREKLDDMQNDATSMPEVPLVLLINIATCVMLPLIDNPCKKIVWFHHIHLITNALVSFPFLHIFYTQIPHFLHYHTPCLK